MSERLKLSACIIARDEERHLPDALASVAFCDEIIVVDSGSRDRTREIAVAAGARVIEHPWRGFGAQRNVAIDNATGDWVLEVDADERISPELRASIIAFLEGSWAREEGHDLALLPLRQRFLGHDLGPSARYPAYRPRLLRRGSQRHDETRAVHEGLWPLGPVWPLEGDLIHLLAEDWGEAIGDAWRYANLEAKHLAGPRAPRDYAIGMIARPVTKVLWRTFGLGGWRDGWAGLAKISLDAWMDCAAWGVRLFRAPPPADVLAAGGHFQAAPPMAGPPRIVGLAHGRRQAAAAVIWLEKARELGIDVALIADEAPASSTVRVRHAATVTPPSLARALDAETQMRNPSALLIGGRRSRLALALLPGALRGEGPPVTLQDDPAVVLERIVRDRGTATA